VTAQLLPTQPLAAPTTPIAIRFVVDGRPAAAALWWRALLRAVLVPLPVLAPLIALAPSRDHRFNVYWHGGLFRDHPLRIVPHTVDSLPGYLKMGNFRLFGRMLEKLLDLIAYGLGDVLGLPVNVAFRLVSFVAAVLLCVTAVLFAESLVAPGRLLSRPPSTLAAAVPFAVAAGFVAAGGGSPVVLFGALYFCSAALVLGVVALLCRIGLGTRLRPWWIVPLLIAGAALAAFNEIAYFALPLATVALAARGRLVLGAPWRRVLTAAPARALALMWLGFAPVFGAVRMVILNYCSAGRCYKGSDIRFGPETPAALPVRLFAWLPPLTWRSAAHGSGWLSGVVPVVALVVLGALAWHAVRDLPRLSEVPRRSAVAVVLAAGGLVVFGAVIGSLNADVQQMVAAGRWGQGWRDFAVTTTAGGVLVAAAAHAVRGRQGAPASHAVRGRRWVPVALIALLAVTATVSATANKRYRDRTMAAPSAILADRLSQEMTDFDHTPAGDARRCALRAEFRSMYATFPYSLSRFDVSFDAAARQRAGVPFCTGVTR
jgi:hypothetical protein